jgi:hypothetical protein
MDSDKILHTLYYIEKNFDGAKELYRKAKLKNTPIPLDTIKSWLKKQATSQKVQPKVGKHEYLSIYSENPDSYQVDLTFLPKYKSSNGNNYVLFTAVNVTSRFAYASYGKNKTVSTIIDMLNDFKKKAKTISIITCDSGSEFTSIDVTKWFEDNNIKTFLCVSDSHKLGIVNRFHRTLKGKLTKLFISSGSYNWINSIDEIIKNYNNTVNEGTGYTPNQVKHSGILQSKIINKAISNNNKVEKKQNGNMVVGDNCRVKLEKKLFDKLKQDYSNEVYSIIKIGRNTVDLSHNDYILNRVKKSSIIIVNEVENNIDNTTQITEEKKAKIARRLKREGLDFNITYP